MCMPCATEFYSFVQTTFGGLPQTLPHGQQIAAFRKVEEDVIAHMKNFVVIRDN